MYIPQAENGGYILKCLLLKGPPTIPRVASWPTQPFTEEAPSPGGGACPPPACFTAQVPGSLQLCRIHVVCEWTRVGRALKAGMGEVYAGRSVLENPNTFSPACLHQCKQRTEGPSEPPAQRGPSHQQLRSPVRGIRGETRTGPLCSGQQAPWVVRCPSQGGH